MSGEPNIVVVQGSAVPASTGASSTWNGRGEKQESRCRDPVFAVLFYVMLISIVAIAIIKGPDAFSADEEDNAEDAGDTADYSGYVVLGLVVFLLSLIVSGILLQLSMSYPDTMIKTALISVGALFLLLAFATLLVEPISGIVLLLLFGCFLCYVRAVWSRIPFASANLVTASTAVKNNCGVIVYAYAIAIAGGIFQIVWTIAFAGILNDTYDCEEEGCEDPSFIALFLLLLAFYFGAQVFQNTIHVTVAGSVGTWWFSPADASSCCSSAVNDSFLRATTTSFGSICFGSLLVAIIQTLEALARNARENGDGNAFLLCLAECILSCLRDILEYFNKWAYIYVGLYGYGYIEAGKNVFQLFKSRGWEVIIADGLIDYLVFFTSLVCGIVMGLVGFGLGSGGLLDDAEGETGAIGALLGVLIGFLVCSILMSVISSGVNTVIVLFAEAPAEFNDNYPDLSQRMRSAWREVYGGVVAFNF